MSCIEGAQLVDLLGGAASPELAVHIDAHVDSCSACRQLMGDAVLAVAAPALARLRTESGDRARLLTDDPSESVSHRYRILGLIGEGGMGRVYRALDRLTGVEVALKQLLLSPALYGPGAATGVSQLPKQLPNLQQAAAAAALSARSALSHTISGCARVNLNTLAEEFRTLAALRHPNIISVLDYGFDAMGQPFYTMELLQGAQSLLQGAQDRPDSQKLDLLIQLLYALAYLNRRGVVHRDLTSNNVLVIAGAAGPAVKVVDFGLAIDDTAAGTTTVAGTLLYMAPELLLGEKASASSDLYAVGVLAYQLLTGRPMFDPARGAAQLTRSILGDTPDLSLLPAAMRPVFARVLGKTATSRQADAATLLCELAAAAGIALKSEPVAARDSYLVAARFVGRSTELRQLRTALESAQRGCGSAWLLGGESGVGKSRLLEELRSTALVAGVLTAHGQARAGGAAYHLWQDVLRILVLHIPLGELEAGVLGSIMPELPQLLAHPVVAPPPLDAPSARLRLQHVLSEALERLPETALIVLEDLQWADPESLALLAYLAGSAAAGARLLVATYRPEEAPQLRAGLPQLQPLPLPRLTRLEIEQLCASMLGRIAQLPALVELVAAETEGNTYFIIEVMRALAAESGSLADIGRSALPQQVLAGGTAQVLGRRLGRVPETARPLLYLAAVAGRQLDLTLLSHLLPQAEAQLAELADCGVIELHAQHWRFGHEKLRDQVLHTLSARALQQLHAELAQAVEQVYPGDTSHAGQAALHYQEAGQLAAAARCQLLAGDGALRRGAPGEAAARFEQARTLQLRVSVPRLEQIRLWRGLTEAQFGLGRLTETEAALRQLFELAGMPLPKSKLSKWCALGKLAATLTASRLGLCQSARPADPQEQEIVYELYLGLGVSELFVWTDQTELSLLFALLAIRLGALLAAGAQRRTDDTSLLFLLSHTPLRGLCRRYLDSRKELAAPSTREQIGYLRTRALIEINDARYPLAAHYAGQAVALARESRDDLALLHALLEVQLAATGLDDFAQVLQVCREMERLALRADNPGYQALAYIGQGAARLALGDYPEAAERIDKARACLPPAMGALLQGVTLGLATACALHLKQLECAEELADQALQAIGLARWNLVQLRHPLAFILETYLHPERFARHTEKIAQARARLQRLARVFPQAVPADQLFQGVYLWRMGRPYRALACFRRSIAAAQKLTMRHDAALTEYWLGCFAASPSGRSVVAEGALSHLRAALATFELLGTAGDAARTRVALRTAEGQV